MHEEFADEGLQVVGVNSIENNSHKRKRLNETIAKYGLSYPTILVDQTVDSGFKVTAYPTIYLVDSNNRIFHVCGGYSEEIMQTLRRVIESHFAKD